MKTSENIWHSKKLKQFDAIIHGTVSRAYGRLSIENGMTDEVNANRLRLADDAGFDLQKITMVKQTHSNHVHVIENCDIGNAAASKRANFPDGDAMVTHMKNVTIVIKTNDCVPVLLYDKKNQVICAAHAGWKGVVSNIAKNAIEAMHSQYSTDPADVVAALGPSIRGCHYDITNCSDGRLDLFKSAFPDSKEIVFENEGTVNVDLANGIRHQLIKCGAKPFNIDICSDCTFEMHHTWPSRRANGNKSTGLSTWTFISLV